MASKPSTASEQASKPSASSSSNEPTNKVNLPIPVNDPLTIKMSSLKEEICATMAEYINEEMDKKKEEIIESVKREFDEKEEASKDSIETNSEARRKFRSDILNKYIYPDDEETIKGLLDDKKVYTVLLQITRACKLIISGLIVPAMILSETKYPGYNLGYVAGVISFLVAVLETADQIIVRGNKARLIKINDVLESIGIKYRLPDTTLENVIDPNASVKHQMVANMSLTKSNNNT